MKFYIYNNNNNNNTVIVNRIFWKAGTRWIEH